jgi:hypothetical protein
MNYNPNITKSREEYLSELLYKYPDPELAKLLDLFKIGAIQMPLALKIS